MQSLMSFLEGPIGNCLQIISYTLACLLSLVWLWQARSIGVLLFTLLVLLPAVIFHIDWFGFEFGTGFLLAGADILLIVPVFGVILSLKRKKKIGFLILALFFLGLSTFITTTITSFLEPRLESVDPQIEVGTPSN